MPPLHVEYASKKALLLLSPACNFEALSLHFHLPLKTAAEKFGVRATAFKKRCRAIGIRHWPYRKVRSLKRSLQELSRCKDQGALNDKQQYQYATFKKQLDKLMAPETYGIDPSGRLPMHHFEDDDEIDDDDSGDDNDSYTSTQSPRYGSAAFADCTISPADTDKTFGDFSAPAHLRIRKQQPNYMSSMHLNKPTPSFVSELPSMPHRMGNPTSAATHYKYPFSSYGNYDSYLHEAGIDKQQAMMMSHPMRTHHLEDQYGDDLTADKYEELRQPMIHDHPNDDDATNQPSHIDYNSERFFDDVFLQISPDYGCLV